MLMLLVGSMYSCLTASAQTTPYSLQNLYFGTGPNGSGVPHTFKIATLSPGVGDGVNAYSHVRVLVTLNIGEYWYANSYIDATFELRNSHSAEYTLRGAQVNPGADLKAYINSDGAMDVYITMADSFVLGDWSIVNSSNSTLYPSPNDTQGSMPGSLAFDAADTENYPPLSYIDFNGNMGIGVPQVQQNLSVAKGLNVDQLDDNPGYNIDLSFGYGSGEGFASTRVQGAPNQYGLDFYTGFQKRVSITSQGNVGIKQQSPQYALDVNGDINTTGAVRFLDGSSFTSANNIKVQTLQIGGNGTGAIIAGLNLDPNVNGNFVKNLPSSGMLLEGWNYSGGGGEQDFIGNRGGGVTGGFRFYDDDNSGNLLPLVTMLGNGRVGIGTAYPNAQLEVNGNMMLTLHSGASITFQDGSVQSTAYMGNTCTTTGGDYAEAVDVTGDHSAFQPGDVMVIDPAHHGHFLKSDSRYSTMVAGIYSTKPGYVGRRQTTADSSAEIPMAMVGIVPTKVTAENGPIKDGDLVVTSSTPGYAMHGTDQASMTGAIVGKALGKLDSGTGVIEVLVSLQ